MSPKHLKIKVGISIGDLNGIGPEIILKSLKDKGILEFFTPIIFGVGRSLLFQKNFFKLQMNLHNIKNVDEAHAGKINILNISNESFNVDFGNPSKESSELAIKSLEAATEALQKKQIDVLVLAPVDSNEIKKHFPSWQGQIDFINQKSNLNSLRLLTNNKLKLATATEYSSIEDSKSSIQQDFIKNRIETFNKSLKEDFWIEKPKIAVVGFDNEHTEQNKNISQAIKEVNKDDILAFGPYSPEDIIEAKNYLNFDALLTMYKNETFLQFEEFVHEYGVFYLSGMPFIATACVDSDCYESAGKDHANPQSFTEAIFTAINIFKNRKEHRELVTNQLKPRSTNIINGKDEDLPQEFE